MKNVIPRMAAVCLCRRVLMIVISISVALAGMAAGSAAGRVTLNVAGVPLENVLEKIEKQTDYRFFYSRDAIDVSAPVSLKATDRPLAEVLDELLAKRGIKYVIDRKQIVLSRDAARTPESARGEMVKVRGNVRDEQGEPLIGVSVTSDAAEGGTTTDANGDYEIRVPAGATLNFSYVGCSPVSRKAGRAGTIDVTLNENTSTLNEVVVMGYGVQKKRLVTGSTLNIKGDDIKRQNSTNALGALYSSVPGVSIVQNNGQPDAGYKVNIRGLGTKVGGKRS